MSLLQQHPYTQTVYDQKWMSREWTKLTKILLFRSYYKSNLGGATTKCFGFSLRVRRAARVAKRTSEKKITTDGSFSPCQSDLVVVVASIQGGTARGKQQQGSGWQKLKSLSCIAYTHAAAACVCVWSNPRIESSLISARPETTTTRPMLFMMMIDRHRCRKHVSLLIQCPV